MANSSQPDGAPARPRWYQFRLRTLLVVVALVAGLLLGLRFYLQPFRQQRQTMDLVESLGGTYQTAAAERWQAWLLGGDHANLAHINLADCDQPTDYLPAISRLPRLETLIVGGFAFADKDLAELEQLATLRTLVLDSTSVSDQVLAAWQERRPEVDLYPSQRRALAAAQKADFIVGAFPNKKRLQGVSLIDASYLEEANYVNGRPSTDDRVLWPLKTLRTALVFQFQDTQVTDAGLTHLAEWGDIPGIYLSRTAVTDAGLRHFADGNKLQELHLDQTQISDEGITEIIRCQNLALLKLSGTRVTDAGVAQLQALPNLHWIILDGTSVSDVGMAHLAAMHKINRLSLNETRITDAGLVELHALRQLESLKIRGTKVTSLGVQELQAALPKCVVEGP